jgi:predicted transcriptional regulator
MFEISGRAGNREEFTPAVWVRKSLAKPGSIISLIDGKPHKTLRQHLAGHSLTPDMYRNRYDLKSDYPIVAPNYVAVRVELAKKTGLGHTRGKKAIEGVEVGAVAAAETVMAVARRASKVLSIVTK